MKFELKRIEATLDQINAFNAQGMPLADQSPDPSLILQAKQATSVEPQLQVQSSTKVASRTVVQPFPVPKSSEPESLPESWSASPSTAQKPAQPLAQKVLQQSPPGKPPHVGKAIAKARKAKLPSGKNPVAKSATKPVHPFPAQQHGTEIPALPRSKPPSFSSHRHAVNPNLAIGLLKEVETVVVGWQLALEQTVLEIQALYMEGPIVDGWLESHPSGSPQVTQPIGAATLRHAEINRLMDYVEEICRTPHAMDANEASRTGYRLCGLDADGQLWSRPCPSQQVPYVSLAIARYQKLRILFAKKQSLENRLNQLIQSLTLLHGQMQNPL